MDLKYNIYSSLYFDLVGFYIERRIINMNHNDSLYQNAKASGTSVSVNVDVPKIVKYLCMAGVLIVGIIFCTKAVTKIIEIHYDSDLL